MWLYLSIRHIIGLVVRERKQEEDSVNALEEHVRRSSEAQMKAKRQELIQHLPAKNIVGIMRYKLHAVGCECIKSC